METKPVISKAHTKLADYGELKTNSQMTSD